MSNSNIIDILQMFNTISATQGTKNKLNVLKNFYESSNDETKDAVKFLLCVAMDPFVITHINKIDAVSLDPIHMIGSEIPSYCIIRSLINKLTTAKSANNELRNECSKICSMISDPALREILEKIITKKLNIGISGKFVNKLFPSLIFDGSVMLASADSSEIENWNENDIVVNVKFDGVRIIAQRTESGNFEYYTRSFNKIDKKYLPDIDLTLNQMDAKAREKFGVFPRLYFVDGELTSLERTVTSGEINKMLSGTFHSTTKFTFNVFDVVIGTILLPETITQAPLSKRIELLFDLFSPLANEQKDKSITVVSYDIMQKSMINGYFQNIVAAGGEGLIIKNLTAPYELKRSKYWVKMKEIKTADLIIRSVNPGDKGTKYQNVMGSLTCESADGNLSVNIGSGFTDEDRDNLWNNKQSIIGRIIEVEYNVVIKNKNNERLSLFLPRFKQFRNDKNAANLSSDL